MHEDMVSRKFCKLPVWEKESSLEKNLILKKSVYVYYNHSLQSKVIFFVDIKKILKIELFFTSILKDAAAYKLLPVGYYNTECRRCSPDPVAFKHNLPIEVCVKIKIIYI